METLIEIFRYLTPVIYWLLIIFWAFIFSFYISRIGGKKYNDLMFRTLFLILSIDSLRTLFESTYFGAWYTSLSGLIPRGIYDFLAQPQIVFFPKVLNLVVSIVIIVILIRKWIPQEEQRLQKMQSDLSDMDFRLSKVLSASDVLLWNKSLVRKQQIGLEEAAELFDLIQSDLGGHGDIQNREDFFSGLNNLITSGSTKGIFDLNLRGIDNEEIWYRCEIYLDRVSSSEVKIFGICKNITEQKVAESKLMDEKNKLYSIFDSIDAIIIVSDLESYEILYTNKYTEDIYGSELEGEHCYEMFHHISAPCSLCANSVTQEKKNHFYSGEYYSEVLDRHFAHNVRVIKWYNGRDVRLEIAYDITESRLRDDYLLKLELAFNQSPSSIIVTDTNGRIEFVNKKTCEITGYDREELLGNTPGLLKSGEQGEFFYKDLWETIKAGRDWRGIFHNRKKNRDLYWEDALISPVYSRDNVITHFIATKEDITEKLELEKDRILLHSAIENISDMIVILNQNQEIQFVNKAFETITGYSRKEVVGSTLDLLSSGEQDQVFFDDIWQTLNEGKSWSGRIVNRKKDGSPYTEQTVVNPLFDETGSINNYVEIKRDITEELLLQEKLHHKSKMDIVGQLAGGIAHDFNNALSGIMSASQLLMQPARNLDEKGQKYADMIFEASRRASELSNRLLTFSRQYKSRFETLDMHKVLKEVGEITGNTLDKKIRIISNLHAQHFALSGNGSELHSAILNLCINSSHAMETGGEIRITTGNREIDSEFCRNSTFEIVPGRYLWVEVADEGSGIHKDYLDKIFEPYFTTKKQGKGTGLGLAAVYGTVRSHKGFIEIESTVGEGTTIILNFPILEKPELEEKEEESYLLSPNLNDHQLLGKILIVDDEVINRDLISDIVESLGYEALVAENGKEALEIYKENHVSLVLLDMIMPVMNGFETYSRLRKINSNCKIIVSSGYSEIKELNEMRKHGLDGELRKPFTVMQLKEAIDQTFSPE